MLIRHISIIYNPKSSGDSVRLTQELYADIRKRMPEVGIETHPTKYHNHAADLAEVIGHTHKRAVIVSVGGDGTYHGVVNGVMRLPEDERPTCVPFAAGNANDHHRELDPKGSIMERLEEAKTHEIDIMKVTAHNPSKKDVLAYAHSYVGFGATGSVAHELEQGNKGAVMEKIAVVRELLRPQRFSIIAGGRSKHLYSLVCTNVGTMAKVMTLSNKAHLSDGGFEVIETEAKTRLELMREVAQSVIGTAPQPKTVSRYGFMLMSSVQAQFDGEPAWLPQGSSVTVTMLPKAIKTLA